MQPRQQYDPIMHFYQQAIPFLFKQAPAVVMSCLACFVMWGAMERRDTENRAELARINREWSNALQISREEWRMCESRREELAVKVAELTVKISRLERRR